MPNPSSPTACAATGDLIGIFDELQIPWQPWFVVMSADGSVIPEYREALRLDE